MPSLQAIRVVGAYRRLETEALGPTKVARHGFALAMRLVAVLVEP
jgi:hypothetical protein